MNEGRVSGHDSILFFPYQFSLAPPAIPAIATLCTLNTMPRAVLVALLTAPYSNLLFSHVLLLPLTLSQVAAEMEEVGSDCFEVAPKTDNRAVIKIKKKVLRQFHIEGDDTYCGGAVHMDSLKLNGVCLANADLHAIDKKLNAECKAKFPGQTGQDPAFRRCYWTRDNVESRIEIDPAELGIKMGPKGENTLVAFDALGCEKKLNTYENV